MEKEDLLRDYSLIGVESEKAIEMGLADAEWYQTPIPRDQMRELLVRKNGPAIRDTIVWFGLIFGSGYLIYLFWGSWYVIFPILAYSILFASSSDSRWHESSHGTAFKTDWMNNLLYEISSFMVFRQSTVWRWSHARHHSDTIIRGRDPEIAVPRPPDIKKIILGFFGISQAIPEFRRLLKHAAGRIDPEVATYVPETEYRKIFFKARIYMLIFLTVIFLAVYYGTAMPLFFVGLPTLIGTWLMPIYGLTQHAGLQENVLDHRLNCRTVYMNRVHRFLYWNMNYHVEHHMFPLVPYHALPRLHKLMKGDCPTPYNGIIETYKEIIPAILKQVKNPSYYVERKLPEKSSVPSVKQQYKFIGESALLADGKITVCKVEELPKGEVIRFDYDQKTYAIYHTGEDRFYATDGICTHGNAHLAEGVIIGDLIECAKHNGRFDLKDGSPKRAPVCIGIKTYPVSAEDGMVKLHLESITDGLMEEKENERTFRVVSNRNVATFIKELVLEPADKKAFHFEPGEYIQMKIPPFEMSLENVRIDPPFDNVWQELRLHGCFAKNGIYSKRNYSMATNPETQKPLMFNIRISLPPENNPNISAGVGSSYVFNLEPGDEVELTGPFGDFHIKQSDREMIYIGGGAGMAPLRSHLSYLFETLKTKRKVSYWYGARSLRDVFYREYFEKMEQEHDNFSYHLALSESSNSREWEGYVGFVHQVLSDECLKDHPNPQEVEYYLCGPPAMIKAVLEILGKIGVSENMIAFDEF
ncbi:MAG: NADH:ubiquinone reductase (Na(+)-transporting) subunit F [Cytophagales bacterium]|nr:NADH:ubiquinone reductase (Na(+)-transporting) subunit F [Cytophagales bacterium]